MSGDSTVRAVRLTPVAFAEPPLRNSAGVHGPAVSRLVIEVETAAGAVGLGETFGDPAVLAAARSAAERLPGVDVFDLAALGRVVGVDPLVDGQPDITGPAEVREPGTFAGTTRVKAYSAFEVAFLDAQGRLLGRPVHQLLGGRVRAEVDFCGYLFFKFGAHPSEPVDDWGEVLDPAAMVGLARRFVGEYGFGALKLKGGVLEPALEVETLRLLAAEFPGVALRIDPNAAWTVPTSVGVAESAAGLLEYLEDPTAGLTGMAEVAAATPTPLATNMVVTSFRQIRRCVELGSAGIVLADHHFWGGLRATQQLGAVAASLGLRLSMHSNSHLGISLAAMVQAAAVLPGLAYSCDTHHPWTVEDVVDAPVIKEGRVTVGDAPGLGVTLDRDRLARMHERWVRHGRGPRDDVAAMRRHVPGWADRRPRW